MKSLRELYRIGRGPSSSHTMAPEYAARLFCERYPDATRYKAVLYGSLAYTGKGHMTDAVIRDSFAPKVCEVVFDKEAANLPHPNTMDFHAYMPDGTQRSMRALSTGGGSLTVVGEEARHAPEVYPLNSFADIKGYCMEHGIALWQYVRLCEGEDILGFLADVWESMKQCVREGLSAQGVLPGGLGTERKAKYLLGQRHIDESAETRENRIVCAYAFAASEQNASCGRVVTAPTCGSCGVMPAVLMYMQEKKGFSDTDIVRALATGGLMGNLIKTNASISGAECGCQAEVGSACSMAAAALCELHGMDVEQIEYAAEVAMEHHLGLTCDPIGGLVQIPCIERNAVAAMRAINAFSLANFLTYTRKISFDLVVETMYETGRDLLSKYKETSEGGLAKLYT